VCVLSPTCTTSYKITGSVYPFECQRAARARVRPSGCGVGSRGRRSSVVHADGRRERVREETKKKKKKKSLLGNVKLRVAATECWKGGPPLRRPESGPSVQNWFVFPFSKHVVYDNYTRIIRTSSLFVREENNSRPARPPERRRGKNVVFLRSSVRRRPRPERNAERYARFLSAVSPAVRSPLRRRPDRNDRLAPTRVDRFAQIRRHSHPVTEPRWRFVFSRSTVFVVPTLCRHDGRRTTAPSNAFANNASEQYPEVFGSIIPPSTDSLGTASRALCFAVSSFFFFAPFKMFVRATRPLSYVSIATFFAL